jgi:NTP-dependent ternary system trypsin peptidase co-occuring protein
MDATVYTLKRQGASEPILFLVESSGEGAPRRAASIQQLGLSQIESADTQQKGQLASVARDLQQDLEVVAAVASTMLEILKKIRPSELALEFGVELGGKFGIPLLTEGSAKANLKVQLKWQPDSTRR